MRLSSQPVENELFVIRDATTYLTWLQADSLPGLVPLRSFLNPLRTAWPYATEENFTGEILYRNPEAYLVREAAEKLRLAQDSLQKLGYDLLIWDAYRPYSVTRRMWEVVPDERYAANPAKGSGHNRGVSVDLTLVDASTGQLLPMPTGFDHFSDTAHYAFTDLPENVLRNRQLLRDIMQWAGYVPLSTEWWHFGLPNPARYPLLDLPFEAIRSIPLIDKALR